LPDASLLLPSPIEPRAKLHRLIRRNPPRPIRAMPVASLISLLISAAGARR
jgi:hypothetical protein